MATVLTTRYYTTGTGLTFSLDPLTNQEVDDNFISLRDNKVEKSGDTITGDLVIEGNLTVNGTDKLQINGTARIYGGDNAYGMSTKVSLTLGDGSLAQSGAIKLWGSTGSNYALIQATTENLHIDAIGSTYLNYYDGNSIYFGNGASSIVAKMDSAGQLWNGNGTNKYWHAGNDGSGSGLDADLLDGNHASAFALSSHTHSTYLPLSGGTMTGGIRLGSFSISADNSASNPIIGNWTTGRAGIQLGGTTGNATFDIFSKEGNSILSLSNGGTLSITQSIITGGLSASDDPMYYVYPSLASNLKSVTIDGGTAWHSLNDGSGSGLDADLLDGQQGTYYQPAATAVTKTSSTGAAQMPAGTTAQQPTGSAGQFRFNTETASFEGYDGSAWGAIGGGSASIDAVASGTIPDGAPVVMNTNGTVSAAGLVYTTTASIIPEGALAQLDTLGSKIVMRGVPGTTDKFVVAYSKTNSPYWLYAAVATVTGTTVTFGTPVAISSTAATACSVTFDTVNANTCVIGYIASGLRARVCTVSGDTLTFPGAEVVIVSGYVPASAGATIEAVPNRAEKYLCNYIDPTTSYLTTQVITLNHSTGVLGFSGSASQYTTRTAFSIDARIDPTTFTRFGVTLVDNNFPSAGYLMWGIYDDSTSTSSFDGATATSLGLNYVSVMKIRFDYTKAGKFALLITGGSPSKFYGRVGYWTGTYFLGSGLITLSSYPVNAAQYNAEFDPVSPGYLTIMYVDRGSTFTNYAVMRTISIPDNSTSYTSLTAVSWETNYNISVNLSFLPSGSVPGRFLSIRENDLSTLYGQVIKARAVLGESNLVNSNYLGIAIGAFTNGQTATIGIVGSISTAQTGLTPGKAYYVQSNGTLSTTADSLNIFAGTAISATNLIVKG